MADVWIDPNPRNGTKESSEWQTVLIAGLRKGGNGYFALDVTDPDADAHEFPEVLWEYTNPTNVGETWSEPFIGKVKMHGWIDFGRGTAGWRSSAAGSERGDGRSLPGRAGHRHGNALKTFTHGGSTTSSPLRRPRSSTRTGTSSSYMSSTSTARSINSISGRPVLRSNASPPGAVKRSSRPPPASRSYHRVEPGSHRPRTTRYLFFGTGNQEFPGVEWRCGKILRVKDTDTETRPRRQGQPGEPDGKPRHRYGRPDDDGWFINLASVPSTSVDTNSHAREKVLSDPVVFFNNVFFTTFNPDTSNPCGGGGIARVYGLQMLDARAALASIASMGETSTAKVPYHVYAGSEGGIPSSPSLSIYPSGQSSIFIGFSTGTVREIKIESPPHMKTIKSWKETF